MSPAADETVKIEYELDILRSRYAIFQRWAKITKWYCIALAVIVPSTLVGYAGYWLAHDPLAAVIAIGFVAVVGGGFYLTRDKEHRWIDVVSIAPGWPWGRMFNIGPRSEAEAIETMIAERERRLAEIKARPA